MMRLPGEKNLASIATRLLIGVHIAIVLIPLVVIVVWAFSSAWPWPDLLPSAFSTRGIDQLFSPSDRALRATANSIGIAIATGALTTTIALMATRAIVLHTFPGKQLFSFATLLPFLIPSTVFAMGIQVAFIQMGLANTYIGVVFAHSIVALPYAIVLLQGVVFALGERLEEQARVLGATHLQAIRTVWLPLLMPGITSAFAMSYILSFSQYFLTLLIGGGVVDTLALSLFPYLVSGDRTVASAYGMLFMAGTLGVFLLMLLLLRRSHVEDITYHD